MRERMLLPTRATYAPDEPVEIEARGDAAGELVVYRLGAETGRVAVPGPGIVTLGTFEPGGYGVEWSAGEVLARTAFDVRADRRDRLRRLDRAD